MVPSPEIFGQQVGCQIHDQAPGLQSRQNPFRQHRCGDGIDHCIKRRSQLFQPEKLDAAQAIAFCQCPLRRAAGRRCHLCPQRRQTDSQCLPHRPESAVPRPSSSRWTCQRRRAASQHRQTITQTRAAAISFLNAFIVVSSVIDGSPATARLVRTVCYVKASIPLFVAIVKISLRFHHFYRQSVPVQRKQRYDRQFRPWGLQEIFPLCKNSPAKRRRRKLSICCFI